MLLILDPIERTFQRDMGLKWDARNYIAVVGMSGTEILRGVLSSLCN